MYREMREIILAGIFIGSCYSSHGVAAQIVAAPAVSSGSLLSKLLRSFFSHPKNVVLPVVVPAVSRWGQFVGVLQHIGPAILGAARLHPVLATCLIAMVVSGICMVTYDKMYVQWWRGDRDYAHRNWLEYVGASTAVGFSAYLLLRFVIPLYKFEGMVLWNIGKAMASGVGYMGSALRRNIAVPYEIEVGMACVATFLYLLYHRFHQNPLRVAGIFLGVFCARVAPSIIAYGVTRQTLALSGMFALVAAIFGWYDIARPVGA